jgi:hypothetical protein
MYSLFLSSLWQLAVDFGFDQAWSHRFFRIRQEWQAFFCHFPRWPLSSFIKCSVCCDWSLSMNIMILILSSEFPFSGRGGF